MNVAITNCSKCDWVARADGDDLKSLVAMSYAADRHELEAHPEGAMFGFKVIEDAVYYHVGTGRTESTVYCSVCDGFYGVPHDHPHPRTAGCACRPCQGDRWPSGGEFRKRPSAHIIDADTSTQCGNCGAGMVEEHAHYRCPTCGARDSCCDGGEQA